MSLSRPRRAAPPPRHSSASSLADAPVPAAEVTRERWGPARGGLAEQSALAPDVVAVPAPRAARRLVVLGLGELAATADPETRLIAYALGSCLGVVAMDRAVGVAGLAHVVLPEPLAGVGPDADRQPGRYLTTAVPALAAACVAAGARPGCLEYVIAGATASARLDRFAVGARNVAAWEAEAAQRQLAELARAVGGVAEARTVTVDAAGGAVWLRVNAAAETRLY